VVATGIENVPIFIKADNAETEIEAFLQKTLHRIPTDHSQRVTAF
jgi:hypothetical protein